MSCIQTEVIFKVEMMTGVGVDQTRLDGLMLEGIGNTPCHARILLRKDQQRARLIRMSTKRPHSEKPTITTLEYPDRSHAELKATCSRKCLRLPENPHTEAP